MNIRMSLAVSIATAATTVGFAGTAHADPRGVNAFQSPSGNIACSLGIASQGPIEGKSSVGCDIGDYTWAPPYDCGGPLGVADAFLLEQGRPPRIICDVGKKELGPGLATLDYGQTRSAGVITCDSEPSGMTCTDTSTGHLFHVSRDSYQLG